MAEEAGNFNHLSELREALHKAVSELVTKACFDIQAYAQENHPWQNETGFTQSSIYVRTATDDTYGETVGAGELLPEVEAPENDQEGYVAVGAAHGIYLEYGTMHMQAYPFMTPAAEAVRPQFEQAMSRLEEALKAVGE